MNRAKTVCIVGRPNVGKSSLFNSLIGYRKAVVLEESGTTRDRVEQLTSFAGVRVKLVDTGGYLLKDRDHLSPQIKSQISSAMEEASLIIFVVDASSGITSADREVALMLRKCDRSVILAANKADNPKLRESYFEFFSLGYGEPVMTSCRHRSGINDLREHISEKIGGITDEEDTSGEENKRIRVAITGRPNVGKSSFLNKLTASNRTIVSDIPGTTRDTVDTPLDYGGHGFLLVDTAGIRHKRKVRRAVDVYSMMRSEDAVRRADVVFLLLDSKDGFTRDDSVILRMAEKYGKACLVLVNKWDLAEDVPDVDAGVYLKHLLAGSSVLEKYPVNFVSSRTGKNVLSTLSEARELEKLLRQDVSTPSINRIFEKNPPSRVPIPKRKKRPNFLYIVQSGKKPVEFTYFVNDPASVLPAHKSFIENKLRERLPLLGIPVTIKIRSSRKGVDQ